MDFVFVPNAAKGDTATQTAKQLFDVRVPAAGHVPRKKGNLQDIVDWVDLNVPTTQKIGNVHIVSHASQDHVSFAFTATQSGPSVYTKLIETIDGGAFRVPTKFGAVPPAGASRIGIVIKGCRIGESEAFMRLLKTLLGGEVLVTAPRHFNGFVGLINKASAYVIDCLTYNHELHRKLPITSHADLVTAFTGGGFLRFDGSPQPSAGITTLLGLLQKPRKLPAKDFLPTAKSGSRIKLPLLTKLKFNEKVAGEKTHASNATTQYRAARVEKVVARMDMPTFNAKPLANHVADAEAKWDATFRKHNVTGGTIVKTFGEHLGLHKGEVINNFVVWSDQPAVDKATKTKGRQIVGTFFRYQLLMPVVSVIDGTLLFESEKVRGPALTNPRTWPTDATQLAALFRTV